MMSHQSETASRLPLLSLRGHRRYFPGMAAQGRFCHCQMGSIFLAQATCNQLSLAPLKEKTFHLSSDDHCHEATHNLRVHWHATTGTVHQPPLHSPDMWACLTSHLQAGVKTTMSRYFVYGAWIVAEQIHGVSASAPPVHIVPAGLPSAPQ